MKKPFYQKYWWIPYVISITALMVSIMVFVYRVVTMQ